MNAAPDTPPAPVAFRRALLAHIAGDVPAAEALYRLALAAPELEDAARSHLIRLLDGAHRWDDALAERRAALRRRPDSALIRAELGLALLAKGDYAEGWPLYESRTAIEPHGLRPPSLPFPEWDGRPVGSLLVWDEQGRGDTLQFARFLPELVARGVRVSAVVRREMVRLLEGLDVEIIPAGPELRLPACDAWAMMASLPGRLGIVVADLPVRARYLQAPESARAAWAPRIGPGARVGVVVRGSPGHANDAQRSAPPEAAAFLLSLPAAFDLSPETGPLPLQDFADTAAVVERLDLVITVDTAVAHLAGALGKPCWVLLPYIGTDWRWFRDGRTDSPWYPSVTLFRQPSPGDWATPLREIATRLPGRLRGD